MSISGNNKRLGRSLAKIFGDAAVPKENNTEVENFDKVENSVDLKTETSPGSIKLNTNTKAESIDNELLASYMVPINLVQPNKDQPRKTFDEEKIEELKESIKQYGIITPLIVKKQGSFYEIIAGERRWRAARSAGLSEVPVVIKNLDEKTTKEIAIIENIQRENLNAVEEAEAYQNLIDEYGLTQDELARRLSKDRSTITNALRLLKLNTKILDLLKEEKISKGHARALLAIDDENLRNEIAVKVIQENLSVRDIEKLAKAKKSNSSKNQNKFDNEQLKVIYEDLERKLENKLQVKIKIIPQNENTGKIEIKYFSKDDLDKLYSLLSK